MVVVVAAEHAKEALARLNNAGEAAFRIGVIAAGHGPAEVRIKP